MVFLQIELLVDSPSHPNVLHISFYCLVSSIVINEKSLFNCIGTFLFMISHFSPVAFRLFSLSLVFQFHLVYLFVNLFVFILCKIRWPSLWLARSDEKCWFYVVSDAELYLLSISRKPWQTNLLACKKCKNLRDFPFLHSTLLTCMCVCVCVFPEQIYPLLREMS